MARRRRKLTLPCKQQKRRKIVRFPCVVCQEEVRDDQAALSCDGCDRWQHLECNTEITLAEYQNLQDSEEDFPFSCAECPPTAPRPNHEDDWDYRAVGSFELVMDVSPPQLLTPPIPRTPVPAQKTTDSPAQQSPDTPAQQSPDTPGQQSPDTPGQQSPDTPGQQSPDTPAQQSPDTPAQQSPDTPAQQSPDTPAQQSPDTPAQQSPDTTAQQSPDTPAQQSSDTPVQQLPGTPPQLSPDTPAQLSPDTPAQQSPDTPAQQSPDTPAQQSSDTPVQQLPGTPPQLSPDTPAQLSPDTPAQQLPDTPPQLSPALGDYPENPDPATEPAEFVVHQTGSQKRQARLIHNGRFSFVKKMTRGPKVYWRCSVRNTTETCGATIVQCGSQFEARGSHSHPAEPGLDDRTAITTTVKDRAAEQVFTSAAMIVETEAVEYGNPPSLNLLTRIGNRVREQSRPRHPQQLDFELNEDHIPAGFLQADFWVGEARHVVFATEYMLSLLAFAKTWYMDGTFKVVRKPFTQLFSIHAFMSCDGHVKQVPLVHVLMSRRTRVDYEAVFRKILRLLPRPAKIEKAVMDFELAVWKALETTLPSIELQGCAFHWAQCVWRKVQEVGLQTAYRLDAPTRRLIQCLLALPLIPAWEIPPTFAAIREKGHTLGEATKTLVEYFIGVWVSTRSRPATWKPRRWSQYKEAVRTNNDAEGWHRRLNARAGHASLNLYRLLHLLHHDARLLPVQVSLLGDGLLQRRQRRQTRAYHGRLNALWQRYAMGELDGMELLKECRKMQRPPV